MGRLPRTRDERFLGVALPPEMVEKRYPNLEGNKTKEQQYYDIHGRWPSESTRVNPVAPEDQFWSEYTDSVAQQRNQSARLTMDDYVNEQIRNDPDAAFLLDARDEEMLRSTTGMTLGEPNGSGRKPRKATEIIDSYPDEAVAIDIENAIEFLRYANTTDPRLLDSAGRALLMEQESSRFPPDYDNPVVKAVLAAAERQLDGTSITNLGNAGTESPGDKTHRARARDKSPEELSADARNIIAQKVMGRSARTNAQTDGRDTDIEHVIHAKVIPKYNNEGVNKYPGPSGLNQAYSDETGAEQVRLTKQNLHNLLLLQMAQDNPNLLRDTINNAPELFGSKLGKKPKTISKKIGKKYTEKFGGYPTAESYMPQGTNLRDLNTGKMPVRKAAANPIVREIASV